MLNNENSNKFNTALLSLSWLLLIILIINSAYLSWHYAHFYYLGGILESFDCQDGCDSVMMSPYARFFSIPVPFYGLAYFIALAFSFPWIHRSKTATQLFRLSLLAACLIAISFLYILYGVLHLHCKFCLISHLGLFLFTVLEFNKRL